MSDFPAHAVPGPLHRVVGFAHVLFAVTVRDIRKTHGNPILGLLHGITQTLLLVGVFYLMFAVLGLRGTAVRGDFLLFIMSGIFLFLTFNKSMGAVVAAQGATSAMMLHAPMNTLVSVGASALSVLYMQLLSVVVVVGIYHLAWGPITVEHPLVALSMLLLSWFAGCSVGLVFMAAKPWAPRAVTLLVQVYSRANMIASGKMFLANTLPAHVRVYFDWNPLFHTIDQARGFTFANYNPHYSSAIYPLGLSLALLFIGLLADHGTRRFASKSWGAGT